MKKSSFIFKIIIFCWVFIDAFLMFHKMNPMNPRLRPGTIRIPDPEFQKF